MRLFLDTANLKEIRHGVELGVISGVTTNPTLVAKEGHRDLRAAIEEICGLVKGPVSVEALSLEREGMVREARELAKWDPNVVVKLPITAEGLAATSTLSKEGVKVNMTLCFSANQALLAALAGATFVSPFVGRLDDAGHDGMAVVGDIADIFGRYKLQTQVLAASIRHPLHCIAAAKVGAHVATVPYKVVLQMAQHPLTDIGINKFMEDWRKVYDREEVKTL